MHMCFAKRMKISLNYFQALQTSVLHKIAQPQSNVNVVNSFIQE
jgi:hypothetical protein